MTEEKTIRFGPAGNSDAFYDAGYKHSWQAAAWLKEMGLNAYEVPFGRGINMTEETASKLAEEMQSNGVLLSIHAPYFINLANPDPEKRENSFRYITDSAGWLNRLGGTELVVHTGCQMKMSREQALQNCADGLREVYCRLDDMGLSHIIICPEMMGKQSQIGDLEEICDLCGIDDRLIPCVDFAHLHALRGGALNTESDFAAALDALEFHLGIERARRIHVHFSTIEYTDKGEKCHRTFDDAGFGPRFEHLAPLLKARRYTPTIICECRGTQAKDAAEMKRIYEAL